jgi:hypothetical protein
MQYYGNDGYEDVDIVLVNRCIIHIIVFIAATLYILYFNIVHVRSMY